YSAYANWNLARYFSGDLETVSFQMSTVLLQSKFRWYVSVPSTTSTKASVPTRALRDTFQRRRNSTVMNRRPMKGRYMRRSAMGSRIGTKEDVGASRMSQTNHP